MYSDASLSLQIRFQIGHFLTVAMLSLGTPMILMGDEVRRTQMGNNNAYCQDNEVSWFDWTLLAKHADVRRFVALLAARRRLRDVEPELCRTSLGQWLSKTNKSWHGVKPEEPDWSNKSHSLVFGSELRNEGIQVCLILNAYCNPLDYELPLIEQHAEPRWQRWIDTTLNCPQDIVPWQAAEAIPSRTYGPNRTPWLFCSPELESPLQRHCKIRRSHGRMRRLRIPSLWFRNPDSRGITAASWRLIGCQASPVPDRRSFGGCNFPLPELNTADDRPATLSFTT
jgi:hypothetical protein